MIFAIWRERGEDECFDECEHHMCGRDPSPLRLCWTTCMKGKPSGAVAHKPRALCLHSDVAGKSEFP